MTERFKDLSNLLERPKDPEEKKVKKYEKRKDVKKNDGNTLPGLNLYNCSNVTINM